MGPERFKDPFPLNLTRARRDLAYRAFERSQCANHVLSRIRDFAEHHGSRATIDPSCPKDLRASLPLRVRLDPVDHLKQLIEFLREKRLTNVVETLVRLNDAGLASFDALATPPLRISRTVPRGLVWSKGTVRAVLRRPLYRGIVTSRWKKAGESFEHTVPALRIIDESTWREANRMLAQATRVYLRRTDGKLWGKPAAGVDSPYLLTGLLACGLCGSVMGAESRPSGGDGKRRLHVYWCRGNRHGRRVRGEVCPNNITVPMKLLDQAVLQTIEPYIDAGVIADAVAVAVKRAGSRATVDAERARLDRELKGVEADLAKLVAFIKRGVVSEALQQELGASEARRRDLRMALDRLAQADAFRASAANLAQKLGAILGDWVNTRGSRSPSSGNCSGSSCRTGLL